VAQLSAADGGSGVRVLIAEDDAAMREALSEVILGDPSLSLVGAAGSAHEIVELAAVELPDVAIVDVRMPGGGGPAAARGIKEVSPLTRVLAFSGYLEQDVADRMLAAGADGYLVKGSAIDTILATIREAGERA
jgi:DNA-binding NarL/FixJ family response regulator